MKNFNNTFSQRNNNDSRKRDFKRGGQEKRQFGNRDRERPQMHEAICADCGKRCEVPFKPTGDKPVYCSQCFSNHRESPVSNRSERRDHERPRFQDKRMFDATCDQCGKRFELPFRPTGDKPVYCNDCFGKGGNSLDKNKNKNKPVDQHKEQFNMLNAKLDRIIRALALAIPVKEEEKTEKKKTVKKKEAVIEKKKIVVKKKKEVIVKKEKAKKPKKSTDKKPKPKPKAKVKKDKKK
ncbi:hypothetical protein KAR26_04170 [Candidatus Parcubacteria bacterium]|nr:hypothetical protein [Candidatus Parcubacteria bacterium]